MTATLRLAAPALGVVLAVSGCASPASPLAVPSPTSPVPVVMNNLSFSAMDLVGIFHSAGLPTPNPHDVTADKCGALHCIGAVDSDTVSILTFDHSGAAQLYAGTLSNSYQVEDVVLTFAATVTAPQKAAYERVVERALA